MKVLVYTVITNDRDGLPAMRREPGVDYVCFSDKFFTDVLWEYRPINKEVSDDPRRVARHHKTMIHNYAFGYDYFIWVDARVALECSVMELLYHLIEFNDDFKVACRNHKERECLYEEASVCKLIRLDDPVVISHQMSSYEKAGYPRNNGLHETGVVIHKNDQDTNRLFEAWNHEIVNGSKRDQLSFDYVMWKNGVKVAIIDKRLVKVGKHLGGSEK